MYVLRFTVNLKLVQLSYMVSLYNHFDEYSIIFSLVKLIAVEIIYW